MTPLILQNRRRQVVLVITLLVASFVYTMGDKAWGPTPSIAAINWLGARALTESSAHGLKPETRYRFEFLGVGQDGDKTIGFGLMLTPADVAVKGAADQGLYLGRSQTRIFTSAPAGTVYIKTPLVVDVHRAIPWGLWVADGARRPMKDPPYDVTENTPKAWQGKPGINSAAFLPLSPTLMRITLGARTPIALWLLFITGFAGAMFARRDWVGYLVLPTILVPAALLLLPAFLAPFMFLA